MNALCSKGEATGGGGGDRERENNNYELIIYSSHVLIAWLEAF
jgi:hypothetical protein